MSDIRGKKYCGYKSFQYLEPGVDYKHFELAKEVERVEPYQIPLSKREEKRVNELYEKCIVIALHDHTARLPADMTQLVEWTRERRYATAHETLSTSCLDAVFDNLANWSFENIIHDIGMRWSEIAHQDFVIRAERVKDIIRAHEEGRVAFIPGIESSTPIEQDIDRIDVLYGLGVRMMGIAYSESNQLGSGIKEESDGGLTYFGHKAVERMNKIGMAIDVSHSGEKTSLDTVKASKKPIFISHAGARGVWNSKRMKSDELIKACAERGGVIGIEASPHMTFSRKHPQMDIESVMDHFEYCVNLVGVDYVSFGLDTMAGDHVGYHSVFGAKISLAQIQFDMTTHQEPTRVEYVRGMENIAEGYNNIVRWLVKHGYSDGEISKIVGGNVLRVLEEVWY